jgi:hypothetical protein
MIKYAVQVFVDKKRLTTEKWENETWQHSIGSFKWKQIKGWNGKSPLYSASNASNAHLTPEFHKAKLYDKPSDVDYYVACLFDNMLWGLTDDYPIIGAQIVKVDLRPIVLSRTEVSKDLITEKEPEYGHR